MEQIKNGLIERLISVTAALIDVMNRELEFLNNMQPQEIRDLQAEKEDLARTYENCMMEIKSDPRVLSACEAGVKSHLANVTSSFQATLTENERALRAVKTVSERLLNVIVNAVADKHTGHAYSANGAIGGATLKPAQSLPFAVNQSL
jgi:hypothetical protein